jgi:hypothetical protein
MLNNLSEQIRECHRKAEDCARKAAAETDSKLKRDYLLMEQRWLVLAQSYELSGRLTDFSVEAKRRVALAHPVRVLYALHIRLRDGHSRIEYNRRGELPKTGETLSAVIDGERAKVRVLNVITTPTPEERAASVHNVYAVEI